MTVHYRKKCLIVKNIQCEPNVETKWNKDQPRIVLRGWASDVVINDDTAYIKK